MKKFLAFAMVFLLAFVIVGCDDSDDNGDNGEPTEFTGTGYALVHGHYVGIATVTVDENGVVTEATLDEYFLPYSWAQLTAGNEGDDDFVEWAFMRGPSQQDRVHAKNVVIGGILFTAAAVGDHPNQKIVYSAPGIPDLEAWLKLQPNAKWYVEQMEAENFHIANADESVHADYGLGVAHMVKSAGGYWDAPHFPLGWPGNMAETIAAVVGMNLSEMFELFYVENPEGPEEHDVWQIGDVVSGATWSDMPDYIEVILRAYYNAIAE